MGNAMKLTDCVTQCSYTVYLATCSDTVYTVAS